MRGGGNEGQGQLAAEAIAGESNRCCYAGGAIMSSQPSIVY